MVRKAGTLVGTIASLLPWLVVIAVVLVLLILFSQRFGLFGQKIELPASSILVSEGEESRDLQAFTFTPRDGIRSIDNPKFVTAEQAEQLGDMVPTEFVMGLSINGESKAYPVTMLSRHEIVNDTVGGQPVAVTF